MTQRETIVLAIHGANQGQRSPATKANDHSVWEKGIMSERDNGVRVFRTINGSRNREIADRYGGEDYPAYTGWRNVWYGDVHPGEDGLGKRLSQHDQKSLVRRTMKKSFDELVPFYELAVVKSTGLTLYETVCRRVLDAISQATAEGRAVVLLGHSMGCAVSYHVLSHLSAAREGQSTYGDRALGLGYRGQVKRLAQEVECLGLITFANPMGFDWSVTEGHRILFGEPKNAIRYPTILGTWRNFWTPMGADPFIVDDCLASLVEGAEKGQYKDIATWSLNAGHSIESWFERDYFIKRLTDCLERDFHFGE